MRLDDLVSAIQAAHASQTQLRIRGAGSKDFYGGMLAGEVLDVAGYRGILAYEPTELYVNFPARVLALLARVLAPLALRSAAASLRVWPGRDGNRPGQCGILSSA